MPGSINITFRTRLWVSTFLLLTAFYVRVHNVTALPPFNDESLHIRRAEKAWTIDHFAETLTAGKALTYYWVGLFNPDRLVAIWLGRTVTGLFALMGLAAAYAVGRRFFGAWGGILTLYLAAFSPFMIFFDRLVFADPLTATLGMLVIWMSLWMVKRPQEWEWGVMGGFFAALAILAKLIGAPFAAIPILGILLLSNGNWQASRNTLIAFYSSLALFISPYALFVLYREVAGKRIVLVDPVLVNTNSPLETIIENLKDLITINWTYHSPFLFMIAICLIILMLRWRIRITLFLLGCTALPWGLVISLSGRLSTRYLQLGTLPLLILMAGGLVTAFQKLPERFSMVRSWMGSWLVMTVWLLVFAQPFISAAWTDPRKLNLPPRDEWEYFSNFTAGYGLMQAAAILPELEASETSGQIPVTGILGSCHQIRLYLPEDGDVNLICEEIDWIDRSMELINVNINQRLADEGILYLLVEPDFEFTDLSQLNKTHLVVGRFARPFDGMVVELWQVFPE